MQAKFSTLLTFLVASLKHPSSVAAITSVGMHAILGVALPSLPLFAEGTFVGGSSEGQNQVNLIESNAEIMSRLPAIFTMPQGAYSTIDGNGVGIPNIQPGNLPVPTGLPQGTPVPSQQQTTTRSNQRGSRPYNYSNSRSQSFNNAQPKVINRGISRTVPNRSTRQNAPTRQNQQTQQTQQNTERLAQHEIIKDFKVREFSNPAVLFPGWQGARALMSIEEPTESSASSTPITRVRDPQPAEESNDALARLESRRQPLRSNSANTTQAEADENNAQWQASIGLAQPRSQTIAGRYPQDACLRRLSGTSVYGVVVQPNGAVTNVQLIQSAGYGIFNQQARSQVQNIGFPNVTRPTPYKVNVTFTYDANKCPELAVPESAPSPAAQPTPQPSPTPDRAPVAQPQPSPTPERDRSPAATPAPPEVTPPEPQPEQETTSDPPTGDNAASEPAAE